MKYTTESLYDPGTAEPLEDRAVSAAPFFAVFDGVSGAYHPSEGWRSFGGKSGGQCVVDIAEQVMRDAPEAESAESVVIRINNHVREFAHAHGLTAAHDLPGMTFAVAKVDDTGVEVVQGGDVFAVWRLADGAVGATPNQSYAYESALLRIVRDLMQKHGGNKQAMWVDYLPILREAKKMANVDGGFVVLNGNPQGSARWYKKTFAPGELRTLILCSDGLVAFDETADPATMGVMLMAAYAGGGLPALLARVRKTDDGATATRHITYAEATALSVVFK